MLPPKTRPTGVPNVYPYTPVLQGIQTMFVLQYTGYTDKNIYIGTKSRCKPLWKSHKSATLELIFSTLFVEMLHVFAGGHTADYARLSCIYIVELHHHPYPYPCHRPHHHPRHMDKELPLLTSRRLLTNIPRIPNRK